MRVRIAAEQADFHRMADDTEDNKQDLSPNRGQLARAKQYFEDGYVQRQSEIQMWKRQDPMVLAVAEKVGRAASQHLNEVDPHGAKSSLNLAGEGGMLLPHGSDMLLPQQLRDILISKYQVSLGPAELGALFFYLDIDGNGLISASEFFRGFIELGRKFRDGLQLKWREQQQRETERAEKRYRNQAQKRVRVEEPPLAEEYTQADEDRALFKLATAAAEYGNQRCQFAGGLERFKLRKPPYMSAREFCDGLRRNIGLKLGPCELRAMLDEFTVEISEIQGNYSKLPLPSGGGEGLLVDCARFVQSFYRLGRELKANQRERRISRRKRIDDKQEAKNVGSRKSRCQRGGVEVIWPAVLQRQQQQGGAGERGVGAGGGGGAEVGVPVRRQYVPIGSTYQPYA
jgi:hypothetical protein